MTIVIGLLIVIAVLLYLSAASKGIGAAADGVNALTNFLRRHDTAKPQTWQRRLLEIVVLVAIVWAFVHFGT